MQNKLKEITERLEKATPAPWYKRNDLNQDGEYTDTFKVFHVPVPYSEEGLAYVYGGNEDVDRNNADFIANSPSDIQFLLDALQELQDVNKKLNELYGETFSKCVESQDRERVLREALEFYADTHNYMSRCDCINEVSNDEGFIARKALEASK